MPILCGQGTRRAEASQEAPSASHAPRLDSPHAGGQIPRSWEVGGESLSSVCTGGAELERRGGLVRKHMAGLELPARLASAFEPRQAAEYSRSC